MSRERVILIFAVLTTAASAYFFSAAAFLFLAFGLICYAIYRTSPPEDRRFILTVLAAGFLLRVFLAIAMHCASRLKGYEGFTSGDDTLYSLRSWALVHEWEGKPYTWVMAIANPLKQGMGPFTYVLASFYKLFGFHPALAKIINCVIGTLIGWVTYLMGREFFDGKAARVAMLIVTFYPSLVRWSAANLQDPMIIFLFLISVYVLTAALYKKLEMWKLAIFGLSAVTLYYFVNKYYFGLVGTCAAVTLYFRFLDSLKVKRMRAFFIFMTAAVIAGAAYYAVRVNPGPALNFIYVCEHTQRSVAQSDFAGYYLYAPDFLKSINRGVLPVAGLCEAALRNAAYFMLTPFPWDISSSDQIMAYPQMLLWYLLLAMSVFGFAKLLMERPRMALLMMVLLTVGIVSRALAEGNIGAAFRHRDVFTPLFVILASYTLSRLFGDMKVRGFER